MFSSFQELLVAAAVFLAVIFIPRMTARPRRPAPKPSDRLRKAFRLSGRLRLGLVITLLWPLVVALHLKPWQGPPEPFYYLGLGPVLLGWSIVWVVAGFMKHRKK